MPSDSIANPFAVVPAALPLLLMGVVAPLAAVDILYFHLWKFRLFESPSSRAETVTHLVRGAFFALGAFMLASYRMMGAWYWGIGALFLLDFLNSIADVALERRSRAPLGGVPTLEYVLHIIGSSFAGAITATYFLVGWAHAFEPTELVAAVDLPDWIRWQGRLMAASGAALTLLELGLFLRGPRAALHPEPAP